MPAYVDADFLHGFDSERVKPFRFRSCALSVEEVTRMLPQKPFGHLAAGRVSRVQTNRTVGFDMVALIAPVLHFW